MLRMYENNDDGYLEGVFITVLLNRLMFRLILESSLSQVQPLT